MSGGGKGGGDTKATTKVDYPKWWTNLSVPVLQDMGSVYRGQANQPLHPLTQEALTSMADIARAGSPLMDQAGGAVGEVIGSGGMTPQTQALAGQLTSGGLVNPAMAETRRIAMGGDVGTNPYLEATYERASRPLVDQLREQVNPSIDIDAASRGRLGSGMHAMLRNKAGEQTGQALTDLATNIYGGAYESDQARRMAALGQFGAMGQQDVANRVAGAGLYDQGAARSLQAAGMAPGIDATRFSDAERLMGIGQTYQNAPWQPAQQYLQSLYGFPGVSSGSSQSGPGGPGAFAQGASGALGGAATGAMIGSMFGGPGIGAALGGGLGLFGGLLSDERAKEGIEPVGITFGGTPIYKYRYREEYGGGPTMVGVLAQDVAETQPEAVTVMPDGMLGVRYEVLE